MRTYDQIIQEILDKKTADVPELTTTSETAVWKLWVHITASAIFNWEQIFYSERDQMIAEMEAKRYGRVNWYAQRVLEFQEGDSLVFDSNLGTYGYTALVEALQIITRVSVTEAQVDKELLIKVARDDGSGNLIAISPTQLTQLQSYLNTIKVAGVDILAISLDADIIDGIADVHYDGNLAVDDLKPAIYEAINIYRDTFDFNGVILKNDLIDIIRDVTGVADILFNSITAANGLLTPAPIVREYATVSGYFNYPNLWLDSWTFIPVV